MLTKLKRINKLYKYDYKLNWLVHYFPLSFYVCWRKQYKMVIFSASLPTATDEKILFSFHRLLLQNREWLQLDHVTRQIDPKESIPKVSPTKQKLVTRLQENKME